MDHKKVILFILVILIYGTICLLITAGKPSNTNQTDKIMGKNYSVIRMTNHTDHTKYRSDEQKRIIEYFYMEEITFLDEELFKKLLYSYTNNSMLFTAFLTLTIPSLFSMLKSIKRGQFEEIHFIYMGILMKYIHLVDGEWHINSGLITAKNWSMICE